MQCVITNVTRVQACLQKLEIDAFDRYFQKRVRVFLCRKAADYSIPDQLELNEVYHTVLKKSEEYRTVSLVLLGRGNNVQRKRDRASCIEQLLSPSFISLGRSSEDVKMLLRTLLNYDKEIIGFLDSIPVTCLDEVLPWIPERQFICPVYSSNPFVSLIKEILFIQTLVFIVYYKHSM